MITMRHSLHRASLSVGLILAACGGDDGGSGDPDAAGPDAMLGDPTKLVGSFVVSVVNAEPPYTTLIGKVYDRTPPEATQWNPMTTDGDCRLLIPEVPFCTTPCGGSAVCVADDTCESNAMPRDVGEAHVSGIRTVAGATEFDLAKLTTVNAITYQVPGTISLMYPGFAAGDPVTITATGSSFTPPFTLTTTAIAPLVVTNPDLALARNTGADLTWTPSAVGATSRILLKLDISHHGGSRGKIECDTADDGALTLSPTMMTQLLDLGAAGFPTIELERRSTGSALTTAGRVDLVIGSQIERPVTVPGIISCDGDEDCTPPATCQNDLTCR
jgi:hypothetical protein